MSTALFSRNLDLKRLRDEGFSVNVEAGALVMRAVPYVTPDRKVALGTFTSSLCMSGDVTLKPEPHTVNFYGEFPCEADGRPIQGIGTSAGPGNREHMLSSKPSAAGYGDYYEKMATYAAIISGPAAVLQPGTTARVFPATDPSEGSVFHYEETASARTGISVATARLKSERILIIGLGGTGSYILDLVAKCPVLEIRLLEGDDLFQHNVFRAPGAPSIETLREGWKKAAYFHSIYSRMHRNVVAHPVMLDESNVHLLEGITFAFICMDDGEAKRLAATKLEELGVPFIDVGMGLELTNAKVGGILRTTTSLPDHRDEFWQRVPLSGGGANDLYGSNIQVACLNMMNAAQAVIKWKKIRGFFRDLENELHSTYTTDGNMLLNGGAPC